MKEKFLFFGTGILLGIGGFLLYFYVLSLDDPMTFSLKYFIYVEPILQKLGVALGDALEAVASTL